MKKAMVFNLEEFEELIMNACYDVVSIIYYDLDGWFFTETIFADEDAYFDWEETIDEEANADLMEAGWFNDIVDGEETSFNAQDFAYSMIGKRFNAIVENIIVDTDNGAVAVIFE